MPRALLILCAALTIPWGPRSAAGGSGWIPPSSITAVFPSATIEPGGSRTLELTVRANGAPASLAWTAAASGQFAPSVAPGSGLLSVGANQIATVSLTVGVPVAALGAAVIHVDLTQEVGGGRLGEASGAIFAATLGRPEIWPSPSAWSAASGASGSVGFQIHSTSGTSEEIVLTTGRANPDPNNAGALFAGVAAASPLILPAGGTIAVSVPTTIAASAYAGNANAIQLSLTSAVGISTAVGHALSSAALADSLPVSLIPSGLVPMSDLTGGRDGPTPLSGRPYWLLASGLEGIRVLASGSLNAIGPLDFNANGADDRLVGRVHIPSFAASIGVVPSFVTASSETLDLGLVAAGRAGLMLVDLRLVEDPIFGTWSDLYDQDENGIDDRILRTIPLTGFATDVAWFRAASGRVVALVADADTGSVPVSASYDPALVAAGTGSGLVAIDLAAAIDSLGGVPYAAGTLATPGNALDVELRRGSSPEAAIADGSSGVLLYQLTAAPGAPATVTFTPRGAVSLSTAWGTAHARDVEWVSNSPDSVYLAVAASGGGLQLVRTPVGGAPSLVLTQQTAAPAIGLAGARTGPIAAAMGGGGAALFRLPSRAELDKIAPGAPGAYAAPVVLARGAPWTEGFALESARHFTPSGSATSLRFLGTAGPPPDLLVADGARALLLSPGQAPIVAVGGAPSAPRAAPLRVALAPNPFRAVGEFRVLGTREALKVDVYDVHGHRVASLAGPKSWDLTAESWRAAFPWDGRDDRGRPLPSGRYWARARGRAQAGSGPFVIVR